MRVLITRPRADAERTAARVQARGHEAAIDSLLTIEPAAFEIAGGKFDAVVITSASALHAAASETFAPFFSLPIFVVGPHSAELARETGFRDVRLCGGNVRALANEMAGTLNRGARVLYLAGVDRAKNLAELVQPAGIEVETVVVYRAVPALRFSEKTAALLREGKIDAVLHYSARSAGIFLDLVQKEKLEAAVQEVRHLCLSDAVASALIGAGLRVETAARPDEDALLALLG
jgi:uroporphyrinogen-III synthase